RLVCASLLLLGILAVGSPIRAELAVTVYNSDLGVIREVRELRFSKGAGRLAFRDVPSRIDPTSVRFKTLNSQRKISILEQNYQFDLVSQEKIYNSYIDSEIELISKDGKIYTGTLLAFSNFSITLKNRGGELEIVRLDDIANLRFPELPEGLITRPTLFWDYSSDQSGKTRCEVSYQTSGMSWTAEYVATLNDSEERLDLSGWSSIDNRSGKTYKDATLKLVAGDIHRATAPVKLPRYSTMARETGTDAGFREKAFFEYHLYTLPRASTIANSEIKQLSLFEPAEAGVTKEYFYTASSESKQVEVKLKFENSVANGLGMPLPGGRVRIFKNDTDGSTILLGEDRISHTPRDEELLLTVGRAFDLVAEETTLDRRSLSPKVTEYDYKISLRNRKEESVTIHVLKSLGFDWTITKTSQQFKKKSAQKVVFDMYVPAGEEVELLFTVRYQRP
ncbi:MAG: DUF4139 domain-containing protein, partial [Candidatus Zixiibacteriota bacterium]